MWLLNKLLFQYRFAGQVDTQLFEDFLVHFTQHDGAVYLAAAQFGQLFERLAAVVIVFRQNRKRHKHLVGVQAGVVSAQVVYFGVLYGLDH